MKAFIFTFALIFAAAANAQDFSPFPTRMEIFSRYVRFDPTIPYSSLDENVFDLNIRFFNLSDEDAAFYRSKENPVPKLYSALSIREETGKYLIFDTGLRAQPIPRNTIQHGCPKFSGENGHADSFFYAELEKNQADQAYLNMYLISKAQVGYEAYENARTELCGPDDGAGAKVWTQVRPLLKKLIPNAVPYQRLIVN